MPTPSLNQDNTPTQLSGIPSLIPLYDYNAFGANPTYAQPNGVTQPIQPTGTGPTGSGPQIHIAPEAEASNFQSHSHVTPPQTRVPFDSPQSPISQLPPTLTDEQLRVMDRLTRDAIDERLRVLEGVSGAVYRCIDDLMRMRSALPSPTLPSQPSSPVNPAVLNPGQKGKQRSTEGISNSGSHSASEPSNLKTSEGISTVERAELPNNPPAETGPAT